MKETQPNSQEQFRIGLIFRVGDRSWFWGRGAAPAVQRSQPAAAPKQLPSSREERWSVLGEWLRQMHAADRSSLDAESSDAREPHPADDTVPDAPPSSSSRTRGIRFVCNRRVIGLLIN
jgi:hypothetical protein